MLLANGPAVMVAKHFSVRLSAACMTGSHQWMEAAGAPAVSSNAEGRDALAAVPTEPAGLLAHEPATMHAENTLS